MTTGSQPYVLAAKEFDLECVGMNMQVLMSDAMDNT